MNLRFWVLTMLTQLFTTAAFLATRWYLKLPASAFVLKRFASSYLLPCQKKFYSVVAERSNKLQSEKWMATPDRHLRGSPWCPTEIVYFDVYTKLKKTSSTYLFLNITSQWKPQGSM